VSVSLTSLTPGGERVPELLAFSMMPLCTTAMRLRVGVRVGVVSFGSPWVAHRVWPMPMVALVRSLTRSLRSCTGRVLVTCSRFR